MTRVEHWGTFEVANFGDLVYPLVLQHALGEAVPDLEVTLAGPLGGNAPMGLGQPVRRAIRPTELGFWRQVSDVDALVVGGGDLVHHGTATVSHEGSLARIDGWSFAVEAGLLAQVRPMAWNGLGVPSHIPAELTPSLRAACEHVSLLAVRDAGSRRRLEAAGVEREISVIPDSAILLDDVMSGTERAAAVAALRAGGRLPAGGPMLVAHVSFASPATLAELAGALRTSLVAHPTLQLVLLAIAPTHDDARTLAELSDQLGVPTWLIGDPTVVEVASVLGAADLVVSSSFHAALTSTLFGVTCLSFSHGRHRPEKNVDLAAELGRARWLLDRPSHIPEALNAVRAGEGRVDQRAVADLQHRARAHMARLVEVVTSDHPRGFDLSERDAAHAVLIEQVSRARAAEAKWRGEVAVLHDHLRHATARSRELEAAYWRVRDRAARSPAASDGEDPAPSDIIDLTVLEASQLAEAPYRWGHIGPLFTPEDATRLARTVPVEGAEVRADSDGRRSWSYVVRPLVAMGGCSPVRPGELDPAWRALADDLAGPAYRRALSDLTGTDLGPLDLEVNVFSYPAGGYQEPHPDLPEKVVTHVLWFNDGWQAEHGGCLRILNSPDEGDVAHELLPALGWSALFVRSEGSWHSVTAVAEDAPMDRRAVVATFYRPGSASTMWPEGD